MGWFSAKYCSICSDKIGMLGNRKLDDGNLCKNCATRLSPWMSDRRSQSVADIVAHFADRDANVQRVSQMRVTRTIGVRTKVHLDENARRFVVSSDPRWRENNADVFDFASVVGCDREVEEVRDEIRYEGTDGFQKSYDPPRYDIDYEFYVTIHLDDRWIKSIRFRVNERVEEQGSVAYLEAQRQSQEIVDALLQVQQGVRDAAAAAAAPRASVTCSSCGATTLVDAARRCEYCGSALQPG